MPETNQIGKKKFRKLKLLWIRKGKTSQVNLLPSMGQLSKAFSDFPGYWGSKGIL